MIINKSGITIRMAVEELRVMGRATQGVRLISLRGKDAIAAICKVPKSDDDEGELTEDGLADNDGIPPAEPNQETGTPSAEE